MVPYLKPVDISITYFEITSCDENIGGTSTEHSVGIASYILAVNEMN